MAGVLTYLAFLLILSVWAVGWLTISGILGSLLKVSPKVSIASGLILGPLGVLYVLFTGISNRKWKPERLRSQLPVASTTASNGDPFQ